MASIALGYAHKAIRTGRRFSRIVLQYPVERQAKALAAEAAERGHQSMRIPEEDGYVRFRADELSGTGRAIAGLGALAEQWKSDDARIKEDGFPINLLTAEDLFEHRALIDLAVHDDVLATVTRYFGQTPRLYNFMLWWSPPTERVKGSQLYHYDHRDARQAKLFVNLNNVTEEAGPLHFLRARDSLRVDARIGYSQDRYSDEEVYGAVPKSDVVKATGETGTGYLVDTARCLHYGSRWNSRDRFVLMASFARANSVDQGKGCRVLDPVRTRLIDELYAGDRVRAFVLAPQH